MDFAVNPLTFVSVPLLIIGTASTVYLLHARVNTSATRCLIGALISYDVTTIVTMFAAGIRFWGGALWPLQDAFAAIGMVSMIQFVYHVPERTSERTLEHATVTAVSIAISAAGLLYSLIYMSGYLALHRYGTGLAEGFRLVMPATFVIALWASVRRTLQVHCRSCPPQSGESPLRWVWGGLRRPADPHAKVLRDFSLALAFGLVQGAATAMAALGWLPWPWDVYATTLVRLFMVVFITSSVLEYVGTPNGIEAKLVWQALTITMVVLSIVGLVQITQSTALRIDEQYRQAEIIRQIPEGSRSDLAMSDIVYVLSWPLRPGTDAPDAPSIAYVRPETDGAVPNMNHLSQMAPQPSGIPPSWRYTAEAAHLARAGAPATYQVVFRYGENVLGTLHTYVGLQFSEGGLLYEVGFSLLETEAPIRRVGTTMVLLVLFSMPLVTGAFVYGIRGHITRPLRHLLQSVAQVNAGNYAVVVPVSYADDIGLLAESFNQLTHSIAGEAQERRAAEAPIRDLNAGLETQVANRTRELAALYEIAGVAGRALSQEVLLNESLTYVVAALNSEAGSVYLPSEAPFANRATDTRERRDMTSAAQAGTRRLPLLGTTLPANHGLILRTYQKAPWLIRDVTSCPDISEFHQEHGPAAMLCLPLAVEDTVMGLLLVLAQAGHIFDLDEITLGASMADQIAVGLQATQLRELTTVLEERERIARDLHDSAIQALYGLVTLTGAASLQLDRDDHQAARQTLLRIGDTGRQAIREMRLFIHDLNPPALEEEGLIGAIHQRLANVEGRANIEARLLADDALDLPLRTQRYLYQIVQEALNNTLKHAHATHVTVYLTTEGDTIVLEILDDGVGFDADGAVDSARSGMGLRSMRRRTSEAGAELHIMSQPGHGTRVRVTYTPEPRQIGQ